MPRVSSKAYDERKAREATVADLTDAQLECRGAFGHQWENDPGATWHRPKFEYIGCYRLYARCVRGCGCVKVAVWTHDGRYVTGFVRHPKNYRVVGIGRGVGRRPFITEYIERQGKTPTGRKRVSDKARRRSA